MHFPRSCYWLMMGIGLSPKFLTKTRYTIHYINAVLSTDSIKCLCHKCHEGHFLWMEISRCLHTLRLVRATSPCLLVCQGIVVSPDTAEGWEAEYSCSIFDRSLKASSCCLWLLSCAVIIVVCNNVPKALQVLGMWSEVSKGYYIWNSLSIYYIW